MAWVTVRQATELTGKARSSLYRDMAKGRVSSRTEADGGRVVDTSELIRVYGELRQDETHERDELRLSGETEKMASDALIAEIKALREEVAGLRQEMQSMRLLEHKPETAETPAGTPRRWWPWGKR
ncbi:entry exclusion protein 1 [Klebsiella aerogenes]